MQRRALLSAFAATASGLILPYEPQRVYLFIRRQPRWSHLGNSSLVIWEHGECAKPTWPSGILWHGAREPLWSGTNVVMMFGVNGKHYASGSSGLS